MKRSWLILLSFTLGVAAMVAIGMTPPTGPHNASHVATKPFSKVVPGAGEDNYVHVWDNALDSFMLEAQVGGGGGGNTFKVVFFIFWSLRLASRAVSCPFSR